MFLPRSLPLDVENIDINTPEPEDDCAADDVFVNGIPFEGEVPANGRMMWLIYSAYEYLYFLHAAA